MFSERSASDELDPESAALAAALAGLVPQHSVNRDRLMFLAGQASVSREAASSRDRMPPHRFAWRMATAAAMLAASLAGIVAGWQWHAPTAPQMATRVPQVRQPVIEPDATTTASATTALSTAQAVVPAQSSWQPSGDRPSLGADNVKLRRRVLSYGIDSLSWPDGAARLDADEERSFWQMRGELFNNDVLPANDRRSLDPVLSSPAGART
jgi:hypothetical protein